jgi:hypothetical protein
MDVGVIGLGGMDWIDLAKEWRALANTVIKLKALELLHNWWSLVNSQFHWVIIIINIEN